MIRRRPTKASQMETKMVTSPQAAALPESSDVSDRINGAHFAFDAARRRRPSYRIPA
jgi:hypothetical protein